MKRLLRVDSDDTEELHNKFRETSKDREEKIRLFEEQLNIKVRMFHAKMTDVTKIENISNLEMVCISRSALKGFGL